ncbi:MAG: hypothetical protein GKR94_17115 [Gammaproteobacteria bacterium]|nr:hypothetical protein [Gammaproteobacteria bacterium]
MTNGGNTWDVAYSRIVWFEQLLRSHQNVQTVQRRDDIIFEVERQKQRDHLIALCCYEYTMGITAVHRAQAEFGKLDLIHIGGGWCGYTEEAKKYCLSSRIGLYVSDEMTGALWRDEVWSYHKKDRDGNPIYFMRSA